MRKKSKHDEQTLEELKFGSSNAVHKQNVSDCNLVALSEMNCSCFCHIINNSLTEPNQSVWENLDLGRVCRPHCIRFVLTTLVKILPYRPPARLIRAKYLLHTSSHNLHFSHFK